ncbi:MAG: LmeA family phospholipid-binding protein [Fimbriimonadaceae bacterium]|nr:LmeA family phospholipid-binding protein [Fimbriimonadaceae bacterium]
MSESIRAGAWAATFADLETSVGLTIEELTLQADATRIETEPFAVSMAPAELVAKISADAVAAFLEQKAPGGLQRFDVQLEDGKVVVEASARVIVEIRARVVCTLRLVDGKQIWVDLASADGVPSPVRGLVETNLAKVNPVFDAADLPLDVTLTSIEASDGVITLHGTAAWKP